MAGYLGNCHASGTDIINKHGDEHVATSKIIVYTSADSVMQIAAHEEHFGLERLYAVCEAAFELVKPYNIGRVIARPFLGENGNYHRTSNRHDYAVAPPAPTLLDHVKNEGGEVVGLGKISDIFAAQGISRVVKGVDNMALFDRLLEVTEQVGDKSLTFVNFVDFDQSYGHRRDIAGYAAALQQLDARLPEFMARMQPGDLAVITADHGCDPAGPDRTTPANTFRCCSSAPTWRRARCRLPRPSPTSARRLPGTSASPHFPTEPLCYMSDL